MVDDRVQDTCWRCGADKDPNWIFCPSCSARLIDTREISPPKPEIDISFLYDLYSFGWYNHHVGAVALYDAAATINHFYEPKPLEHFQLDVEPGRAQKILRAKIFAEYIALLENFGVLCLAIKKRARQSVMWTYLNTEPQEVAQFYEYVLSFKSPPSLQRLLDLPRVSDVRKAMDSDVNRPIAGLTDNVPQLPIENVIYDYKAHSENINLIAKMYREGDARNVVIYNKIKHVFSIVEGTGWLHPPLGVHQAGIALDDKGKVAPLPMGSKEVEREIIDNRLVMHTGAELLALYLYLYRVGAL